MTTTVQKQVLINARALIADPEHWTSGTLARDDYHVDWYDHSATKWCAMGAIYRNSAQRHIDGTIGADPQERGRASGISQ